MYSRFQGRSDESIRIPEHYSGCAFSKSASSPQGKQEEVPQSRPHPIEASRPSPPPKKSPPPALLLPPRKDAEEKAPPPLKPSQGLWGELGRAFPFSHGIGFEELLILGLILLLAQSETDGDMILWLALLLFCG